MEKGGGTEIGYKLKSNSNDYLKDCSLFDEIEEHTCPTLSMRDIGIVEDTEETIKDYWR